MSAASALPLRTGFHRQSTETLIQARDVISLVLDDRARQASLFEVAPAAPAPVVVMTPPPAAVSEVPEVLSPSAVNTFSNCEAKWFYRRILQLPDTRSAALALGSAVHTAVASNFRQKIDTRADLPYSEVRPVFLESLANELDTATLSDDDDVEDLRNCGEALVRVYLDQAAPSIQPAAVELEVAGKIGDVHVRGYVDLLDVDGNIVDLKTASKKPVGFPGDHRLQVTSYAMITPGASGRARLDTLTKTKTVALHSQTTDISAADRKHAERLYSISLDQMKTGLYKPNRSSYLCSRKYCPYADQCVSDFGGEVD